MTELHRSPQIAEDTRPVDAIAFDWDMTVVDSRGKLLQDQAIA